MENKLKIPSLGLLKQNNFIESNCIVIKPWERFVSESVIIYDVNCLTFFVHNKQCKNIYIIIRFKNLTLRS